VNKKKRHQRSETLEFSSSAFGDGTTILRAFQQPYSQPRLPSLVNYQGLIALEGINFPKGEEKRHYHGDEE
jgi:hypothetical protein